MTAHKDLKKVIRARQLATGEPYTTARARVLCERDAARSSAAAAPDPAEPGRADAAVLKTGQRSARVRLLGEDGSVTFRSPDAYRVVPGHLVTLVISRRWIWRGDSYASGRIENPRIAVEKLGLVPLPLEGGEPMDIRSAYEGFRDPDPFAPLWRRLSAEPRARFVFDPIAWGALPGTNVGENPVGDAVEFAQAGDRDAARELLMELLCSEPRCIDAHGALGGLEFDRSPERAMLHYQIGMRVGELSLPAGFDGVLPWGHIYNRPFLRCLHGLGLCLWRSGRPAEAHSVFERILSLNPNDNQGVRFCWQDVREGRDWEAMRDAEV